ncbi:Npun_R1517 family heterocyst differentiation transcriptional regulator [filamentous cyanobacterium LEGE 07170]|nr:Npun_R1517 family heterocyst differentiation transcriptional regulator [filamentous cyanobacterium LEGE 07170]
MNSKPVKRQSSSSETPKVGIYECEVHMKFRLIEEKQVVGDRDHLLETLLDAVACGTDEYLNDLQVQVTAEELSEIEASPRMRRQIIRLRNSRDFM